MDPMQMMGGLPPEFQAEMQKILRQRKIAEAMQMQAMQPRGPTQVIGGYAVKDNPLATALQAFTGYQAGKRLEAGDKSMADMMQRYQQTTSDEMAKLLAPGANPQAGLASMNPKVAALAKILADRQAKQGETVSGVLKDIDPKSAVSAAMGNLPQGGYTPPSMPDPTFGTYGDNPYAIQTGKGGVKEVKFGPKGQTINVDTKGEVEALKALGRKVPETFENSRDAAIKASEALTVAQDTIRLAKDPSVIAGFAAGAQTGLASLGAKLGYGGQEAVGKTQALISNLAKSTLEASKDLKGSISDKDVVFLGKAASGEINYTPEALQHLAALSFAANHNKLMRAKAQWEGTASVPGAEAGRAMYPWPGISHTLPQGFDFQEDPKTGMLRYNGGLFNPVQPSPVQPPNLGGQKPVNQMSPQEIQAEIDALKGRLGLK